MKTIELRAYLDDEVKKYMTPQAQTFTLQTWYKYMFPYIPFVTGTLASGAEVEQPFIPQEQAMQMMLESIDQTIHFKAPYATRMYYGENFNFNKDQHPLAQARWAETALDLHWGEISKQVKNYVNKGVK